jgi:hypothetical protein
MADPDAMTSPYLRRLELAMDRISDATRRLTQRDRLWVLNTALRSALAEQPEPAQAARSPRRSSATS